MAASIREQTRALANLSMHEHRLSRQFERTLNQLREIQADRKAEGIRYDPAEDGRRYRPLVRYNSAS
jgi:hypothetical protein